MKLDSDDSRRESETKGKRKRSRRSLSQSPSSDWDPAEIWCYNCASRGSHWGDDCPERYNARGDPSAYSHFMSLAGPFGSMFASRAPLAQSTARTNEHIRFGESTNHAFDFDLGDGASIRLAQDPSRHAASIVDQLIDSGRATGRDKRARGPPSRRGRVGGGSVGQKNKSSISNASAGKEQRRQRRRGEPEFGRFARADGAEHSRPASTFRPQFHGDY
ncbi:AIR1_2 [Ceraceosorus bombacis]|uniref:AIR1_2 n=1 Tax=Ceraceosorus bombacis TaxID=401625 RepID=A0A0P1BKE8_9BASI|nr:AIR1_2 [Ceraceosorus bombacis]